jgi:hypothetical protein
MTKVSNLYGSGIASTTLKNNQIFTLVKPVAVQTFNSGPSSDHVPTKSKYIFNAYVMD